MKQNEHEIDEAEEMSRKIGVDLLRFIPVGMPYDTVDRRAAAEEWFPVTVRGREHAPEVEQQFGQAHKPSPCFYLYRSMVVNADGGVSPCCVVNQEATDFGRVPARNVHELWNNAHYQSARSLFGPKDIATPVATVCDGCDIFRKYDKPSNTARVAGGPVTLHGCGAPGGDGTPLVQLQQ
jgi:MoaA/NifB/PqqE/SkfB family radical SAM enzyme